MTACSRQRLPQVTLITEGNFALTYVEDKATPKGGNHKPIPVIVDPVVVFGHDTTMRTPLEVGQAGYAGVT